MTWKRLPLRRVAAVVNGGTPSADDLNWNGDVPWATPVDLGTHHGGAISHTGRNLTEQGARSGSSVVPAGSVLVSTRAPIGYVAQASVPMAFNQGCRAVVPSAALDSRFLAYSLVAAKPEMDARGLGTTFRELSSESLSAVPVMVPPLEEQRRIADFLDTETTRLDALAAARHRQAAALDEWLLALISHQIAGRDVPGSRQETGWGWLPDLPANWAVGPVFGYFDVRLGKMLNAERAAGPHLRPYLRNANVHWYEISVDDLAEMSFEPGERLRYRVEPGDLLICEGGAGVAEAAVWRGEIQEIYFQKSLHRARPTRELPAEWLMHWLRLAKHSGAFAAGGNLATIPHLTGEQLRSYRIPIPPDAPLRLEHIDRALQHRDRVRRALAGSIGLLGERRQALITAAVTGQLDVTTAHGGAA